MQICSAFILGNNLFVLSDETIHRAIFRMVSFALKAIGDRCQCSNESPSRFLYRNQQYLALMTYCFDHMVRVFRNSFPSYSRDVVYEFSPFITEVLFNDLRYPVSCMNFIGDLRTEDAKQVYSHQIIQNPYINTRQDRVRGVFRILNQSTKFVQICSPRYLQEVYELFITAKTLRTLFDECKDLCDLKDHEIQKYIVHGRLLYLLNLAMEISTEMIHSDNAIHMPSDIS